MKSELKRILKCGVRLFVEAISAPESRRLCKAEIGLEKGQYPPIVYNSGDDDVNINNIFK